MVKDWLEIKWLKLLSWIFKKPVCFKRTIQIQVNFENSRVVIMINEGYSSAQKYIVQILQWNIPAFYGQILTLLWIPDVYNFR